jgi:hypothetical protein
MRKFFLFVVVFAFALAASAQLENTKWRGMAKVPEPFDCVFDFRKDTVVLSGNEVGVIETMKYRLIGDTLVLKKLNGKSPCAEESEGYFKIVREGDSFKLTSLKDDCPGRAEAFVVEPWVRIKEQ